MSDSNSSVERWQAPFFESAPLPQAVDPLEIEAQAQERGFNMGKWQGLEAGRAEAENLTRQIESILLELTQPFQRVDQVVTQELVKIAMAAARQIVRRELTIDSAVVEDVMTEAVATLSSVQGEVEVFLNPADRSLLTEFCRDLSETTRYKLTDDPDMLPGGCRIKTPVSFVDGSVERQIEEVFAVLSDTCEQQLDD
ncbi:FliH/SctL family protein [Porticoccus sp.]